jgi:hypothetical protein
MYVHELNRHYFVATMKKAKFGESYPNQAWIILRQHAAEKYHK